MEYDKKLWTEYTLDNEKKRQEELSKFIYHIAVMSGAQNICEIGCNVGNNLSAFPKNFNVHGIDLNQRAIEKARKRYRTFKFRQENISKTSYPDSFFDIVFTRGVLIHIPQNKLNKVMNELIRISRKWIFNLEYFGKDGEMIKWKRGKDLLWYRNMKKRWKNYEMEIISDVNIPKEIDSGKVRFTLVKKKNRT